jgi:hypothetical protein
VLLVVADRERPDAFAERPILPRIRLLAVSATKMYGTVSTSRYARVPAGLIHVLCGPVVAMGSTS